MGLVIDTNFFINVENKRLELNKLEEFYEYGDAYIAAVTASELLVGVHLASSIEIESGALPLLKGSLLKSLF